MQDKFTTNGLDLAKQRDSIRAELAQAVGQADTLDSFSSIPSAETIPLDNIRSQARTRVFCLQKQLDMIEARLVELIERDND